MADNYLEKKMEELRSGKLAIKKAIPGIKPKARRVLVAGGCSGIAREKALKFRQQGHRVAIFDDDELAGKSMAHDHGIRFHRVSLTDEAAICRELQSLLTAWRGLDIIVSYKDTGFLMQKIITDWKENLPIPDKSDINIVII